MYKQGLGDCFLLTFPRNPKPFHMLIDCGALKSKHYDAELMKNVVRDIQIRTDNHLDVVIATHEHWDHISGFTDAREEFDAIEFEQVWVAWTENPQSEAAKILKKEFKKGLKALAAALEKMPP
jgi:glyoxylase-like metal-dependent hydrolase (beta-lactamase superfamily II)